jgi:PGF-pre-PGF domain-containing protein
VYAQALAGGVWRAEERAYGPGYARFTWPAGAREGTFLQNAFPFSRPSVAVNENGEMIAVWMQDNVEKPILKSREIYYSRYDPATGSWSRPSPLTSDNLLDLSPSVIFDSHGNAVAVWHRIRSELGPEAENVDAAGLSRIMENVELVYSVWSPASGSWSPPSPITSNARLDAAPVLARAGENLMLVWIQDADANPFTADNNDLCFSIWSPEGSSWSPPRVFARGLALVSPPSLAMLDSSPGLLVISRDMDGDLSTREDAEIFYAWYERGSWENFERLTNDHIMDSLPSAAVADNKFYIAWVKDHLPPDILPADGFGICSIDDIAERGTLMPERWEGPGGPPVGRGVWIDENFCVSERDFLEMVKEDLIDTGIVIRRGGRFKWIKDAGVADILDVVRWAESSGRDFSVRGTIAGDPIVSHQKLLSDGENLYLLYQRGFQGTPAMLRLAGEWKEVSWLPAPGHYYMLSADLRDGHAGIMAMRAQLTRMLVPIPDFRISLEPGQVEVPVGGSATIKVSLASENGYQLPVELSVSGLPEGTQAIFTPASGTPPFESSLELWIPELASPGEYEVTITGTGSDGRVHSAPLLLLIPSREPDFQVLISPESGTLSPGETLEIGIEIASLFGYEEVVGLEVKGIPDYTEWKLDPSWGVPTFGSTLVIYTSELTPEGLYELVITGVDEAGKARWATFALEIASGGSTLEAQEIEPIEIPIQTPQALAQPSMLVRSSSDIYVWVPSKYELLPRPELGAVEIPALGWIRGEAGSTVEFPLEKPLALRSLRIRLGQRVERGLIATGELENLGEVPEPPGSVYTYLNLTTDFPESMEEAELEFEVPLGWIERNGIEKESITLLRYDGDWRPLRTAILWESEDRVRFSASVEGFSLFAIAGTREVPGAPLALLLIPILAGVLAAIALSRKRVKR